MKNRAWLILLMMGLEIPVLAAVPRNIAPDKKMNSYIESGAIIGGKAEGSYSLLNVRRIFAPKEMIERVILDMGDDKGKPLVGRFNYFQVSLDKNQPRVVIDLPQMAGADVSAEKLKNIFKASPYVKETKINFDPTDSNITIQLLLKKSVKLEVFKIPSEGSHASRLVVDLKGSGKL